MPAIPISVPAPSGASLRAMTIFAIITAATFSATGAAPTPLYRTYQENFGLTPVVLTVIFAVYSLSLLGALLTVASLSDYIGRRPVIFAALLVNVLAMILFVRADSAMALIIARLVNGLAIGVATTTMAATILDANRSQGPLINSVTPFAGLGLGVLAASLLVTFAPLPTQLIYIVLSGLLVLEAMVLWLMPETAATRPGALASLWPHVRVPPQARQVLLLVTPINVAAWALGGFNFSLMPSLVRVATGLSSPLVGGIVATAMPATGTLAIILIRGWPAERLMTVGASALPVGVAIILLGVMAQFAPIMLLGAMVAGFGFGAAFLGAVRSLLPLAAPNERAGLVSAFYVESYLAFAVPARPDARPADVDLSLRSGGHLTGRCIAAGDAALGAGKLAMRWSAMKLNKISAVITSPYGEAITAQ